LYTAGLTSGSATVQATSAGITGMATASVTNTAPSVAISAGAAPAPVTGFSANLSVLGSDLGGEANLTYTWATTGTPPAAVGFSLNASNAAKNTVATFSKSGMYNFQVTITDAGGLTATSSVSVTVNQTLTSITVGPTPVNVYTGQTKQLSATALDQFGDPLAVQPAFNWSVDSGSTGNVDAAGLYTASANMGAATVRATSGAVSGTATVNTAWLKGDLNGDGKFTGDDLDNLLIALTNPAIFEASRGMSAGDLVAVADLDGDTIVTNADMQPLINLISHTAINQSLAVNTAVPPLNATANTTMPLGVTSPDLSAGAPAAQSISAAPSGQSIGGSDAAPPAAVTIAPMVANAAPNVRSQSVSSQAGSITLSSSLPTFSGFHAPIASVGTPFRPSSSSSWQATLPITAVSTQKFFGPIPVGKPSLSQSNSLAAVDAYYAAISAQNTSSKSSANRQPTDDEFDFHPVASWNEI
ncbi:MAG TPA: Ig-like domain-containing protein, partial [Pirellulales bacterium]